MRISRRYPLIEILTAAVFLVMFGRIGVDPALPAFLYLGAIGVALAAIDLDVRRLPDAIVLPAYPVLAVLLTAAAWAGGDWERLARAGAGGAILFVFYAATILAYPKGMGAGDVKLAGVLGAALGWCGWGALVVGSFAAFLLGGLYAVALLAARRAGRRTGIPFGPWMVLGTGLGIVAGNVVWEWYLQLMT